MENVDLKKGANQLWKESGSLLPFKDWLQREKDKGRFLPNKKLEEFNNIDGDEITPQQIIQQKLEQTKKANASENAKTMGFSKSILAVSFGLILIAVAINNYKNKK